MVTATRLALSLGLVTLLAAACSSGNDAAGESADGGSQATSSGSPGTTSGSPPSSSSGAPLPAVPGVDGGLGSPSFAAGDLDAPSNGGTLTFQSIGKAGSYPSRSDPASGQCNAYQTDSCCLETKEITSDALTPWDQDLVLTLRGPMIVKQLVVYQSGAAADAPWNLVSTWDERQKGTPQGISFTGNAGTTGGDFAGTVGSECLVNVATDVAFPCGAGSSPYCPPQDQPQKLGWTGSKMFVLLARMPHADEVGSACSNGATDGNWYDAPWLGLSVGELVRAGSFVSCQCYAKDPDKGYLADGCGQFNVFETVNDNNQYKNLDVFSTNMIGYGGYVGEGPCGPQCDASKLAGSVDLIDKHDDVEAPVGGVTSPDKSASVAFRRPESSYRYFVIMLDVPTRTVQMGLIHPSQIPTSVTGVLPGMPSSIDAATVAAMRDLRLPH